MDWIRKVKPVTVDASISGHTPSSSLPTGSPYDYRNIGWSRSLYAWEANLPQITIQPADQTVPSGGSVTLSITVTGAINIDWYDYGGTWVGSGSTLTMNNFTTAKPNLYVARVSNNNGQLYSRPVKIFVGAVAQPTITSVSPSALIGLSLPQKQLFQVFGSGFTANSTLTFNDGVNPSYTGRVPTFVSANELDYNIAVGTNQANWTVQVIDGARQSNLGYFTVASPAQPSKGSLVVTLSPLTAISAGAQWQVDGGVYHNSGDVVANLTIGSHTVSCKSVSGFSTPSSHSISITSGNVTFDTEYYTTIPNTGSLTVYISPSSAISSGALWQIDSGSFHNSGDTVNNLLAGSHTITFNSISGYIAPSTQQVTITTGGSLTTYATYSIAYSVIASAFPYGDGGATGGGIFAAGSSITVSAVPRLNYAFVNWTENGSVVSTLSDYSFTLNTNRNLVAIFRFWGPTVFMATAVSKSAFGLTWDSYANSQASLIIEKTNETTGSFDVVATLPAGSTVWVDTNVIPSHNYSYRIRSWDGIQNYSAYSPTASKNTQPATTPGSQCTLANGAVNYWAIASDANNVYWSAMNYAFPVSGYGSSIWKVSKTDGTLTPLATGIPFEIYSVAIYGNYLYWAECDGGYDGKSNAGAIRMVSINGGPITTITSNNSMGARDGIRGLAVDQSGIYWAEDSADWTYSGRIRGVVGVAVDNPLLMSQTSPIILADNRFAPIGGLSVDNGYVYWLESDPFSGATNRGAVMQISKSGGIPTALASNIGEGDGLAIDSTNVYFGEWNDSVYFVPKVGGVTTKMGVWGGIFSSTYTSSDFLASDKNYVYYTSLWGASIGKIDKVGGRGVTVVSGLTNPWGLAVDVSGLFWTEEPTTSPADGKVGMLGFVAPQITSQPQSQAVPTNVIATFSVIAYGTATLNYQWQQNGTNLIDGGNLSGASTSTLSISGTQTNNAGKYTVVVNNSYGTVTSAPPAILIVDGQKPTNQIVLPTAGLHVSNAVYVVTGKAGDNVGVSNVYYQLNNGGWNTAATANYGTNWTAQVILVSGTNVVQAYAMDYAGNKSTTNSVNFVYVISAPLQVQIVGKGTISPNYSNAILEIGKSFSMTATPGGGFSFVNWTGSQTTNGATITFLMASNLSFTANFADTNKPAITITAPTAGQRWSNLVFTASGTATDNWQVASVQVKLNGGIWTNATGTTNWSAPLTLTPGTNTLAAYATDTTGNNSPTNSVSWQYVVTNQLQVSALGLGTISPNYSNSWLEIGRNYSMTATPASGFVVTNWTISTNWLGGRITNNATVQFMMASNLTLQVNFADVTKPTLTITAPTAGQKMTNALATFVGTASDNWKVAGVWYQLNSNTWNLVTATTNNYTNWTQTLPLIIGTNTLKAYALDLGGNFSTTNTLSVISSNTFMLQLAFTNSLPMTTNGLVFSLQLSKGLNGHIQVSTNLTSWLALTNFVGSNATITFRDPAATNSARRFYRAVIP